MKAAFITYVIKEWQDGCKHYNIGDIVSVEIKISGLVCKVADRHREPWQSVVRYTLPDNSNLGAGLLGGGKIIDRNLVIGNEIILKEDKERSIILTFNIEKEK